MTAPARIKQGDVTRLMRGCKQAGYTSVRLVFSPDGSLTVHADDTETKPADDWRSKQPLYRDQ